MNVCITLCYAVGRGVQSVYGGLKEKRAIKQGKTQLHIEGSDQEEGEPSASRKPRHDSSPTQRRSRRGSQSEPSSPESTEGNRVLGISSEARAAAHAYSHRSVALVAGVHQARRANLFDTRRYEVEALPPPKYDASAPRLPNYAVAVEGGTRERT